MSGKARETPPLTYIKEKYEDKTTAIKFIYRGRNKKVTLPVYREGSYEEFVCLIQDVENWMIDYELQQDLHIAQVYESFIGCLKGSARDTWIAILKENPGQKTYDQWKKHMGIFVEETLPEESARKQIKYLKNTTKPRKLNVRKWVRRIKNINSLLPMMGGTKLSEEEIVKEVIAPNLPESWSKSFHLAGAHLHESTKKAMNVLEILENDEQLHKSKHVKPHQRNQRAQARGKRTPSRKNMCKHHRHPNANHEWKDCIYNPKSKNYCGHKGRQDKKKEEENHHIRPKRHNKAAVRHPMSSSSSSENSLKSDTSSVESNYQIEEKNIKQSSDTMSAELLLGTKVSNQTYRTLLDTGSSASIVSHEVAF